MTFQQLMDAFNINDDLRNQNVYTELLKQMRRDRVTPVIGAGISCWAGYPLWARLLAGKAKGMPHQKDVVGLLQQEKYEEAAQNIEDFYQHNEFLDALRKSYSPEKIHEENRPGYQRLLDGLFPGPFVTTNFDVSIELLLKETFIVTPESDFHDEETKRRIQSYQRMVVKVHGTVNDPEHMILTESSYNKAYGPDPQNPDLTKPLPNTLKTIFQSGPPLFLGCGLGSDRTCAVLRACKGVVGFALLELPEETENKAEPLRPVLTDEKGFLPNLKSRRKLLSSLNLKVIWYPHGHHEAVSVLIRQLSEDLKNNRLKPSDSKEKAHEAAAYNDSCSFVDKLALDVFQKSKAETMAKAIMLQDISNQRRKAKSIREDQLRFFCSFIKMSKQSCPLLIKGIPGTGKSTLLSLLYLQLQQEFEGGTFLFDLHVLDNTNKRKALPLLERAIEHIETLIHQNEHTLLFFDGLNQYKRHYPGFEDKLRKHISEWQKNSSVQVICSVGIQDDKQYPPFERFVQTPEIHAEKELTLLPIDVKTDKFSFLLSTVLMLKSSNESKIKSPDEIKDRLITYCGLIDDGKSTIRTAAFIVNQYSVLGRAIFSMPAGELLYNYYKDKIGIAKIKKYAESVAAFMLEMPRAKIPDVVTIKSLAALDFFFAYYYVESCTDGNKLDFIKNLDCVFTSRINRFVMQIAQLNAQKEESFIAALTECYNDNLPFKTRTQIAYFLGRAKVSQTATNNAIAFLKSQYERISKNYDNSRKNREEVMLLRTIGISLLYLGDRSFEKEFYSLIIYDEAMNRINRDFHIAYYTTNSFKLTDNTVFDKNIIYNLDNIKHVYSFLYHSVGKNTSPKTRCINIITIISLVIYWIHDLSSKGHTIEAFNGFGTLLATLSVDSSIPDVIRDYIITTHSNLGKATLYEDALKRLYEFKSIKRTGWLRRGIGKHSNVRIESDAEHTWACCILANILLPENIYDCELIMMGSCDFENYLGYQKQKVLGLLLVHDLPECITGDIATPSKTNKDEENEKSAINNIRALGAFPGLSALYDVADDCDAFHSRDNIDADINVRIASDIDRLEPLIQLYFYRRYLKKPYDFSELTDWINDKRFRLHTSFGNGLLEVLKKIFLNEERFQNGIEELQ